MATQAAPFAFVNLGIARQQLANRLYDSGQVFWSPAELTQIIVEALRTWNALTGMWRSDWTFQTTQGTLWYDLTQQVNSNRPYTVTDATLYQAILYHLLEPATGPASVQVTTGDLSNAVQRRRDEVLSVTSCTQTRRLVPAVNGRITLPDSVIDVRRMAYLPAITFPGGYGSGYYGQNLYGNSPQNFVEGFVMWPEDAWAEQSFDYTYTENPPGKPSTYLMSTEPPLSFDTNCPPDTAGQYELLTVEAGGTLAFNVPSATGTTLLVPDDWTHVIKWGALADLFGREANARDPLRQTYCEQRYKMGLALLAKAPALLAMRIGNVPLQVDSVRAADLYDTNWEATPQGTPGNALHSGLNLVALDPTPDAGPSPGQPYQLTVTSVENAPIPVADTDQIQMSRGDYDVMLDYSVHLAMLKVGGAEFMDTMPLFERFMKQAGTYGLKLDELGEFRKWLYGLSVSEKDANPVMAPAEGE
jgi:hypothetical protein